jgi:predicted membrane protein
MKLQRRRRKPLVIIFALKIAKKKKNCNKQKINQKDVKNHFRSKYIREIDTQILLKDDDDDNEALL